MKKLSLWVALATIVAMNGNLYGLAEDKPQDANDPLQSSQTMTPAEKYNMLGKQIPSQSDAAAEAQNPSDPASAEACKDKQKAK